MVFPQANQARQDVRRGVRGSGWAIFGWTASGEAAVTDPTPLPNLASRTTTIFQNGRLATPRHCTKLPVSPPRERTARPGAVRCNTRTNTQHTHTHTEVSYISQSAAAKLSPAASHSYTCVRTYVRSVSVEEIYYNSHLLSAPRPCFCHPREYLVPSEFLACGARAVCTGRGSRAARRARCALRTVSRGCPTCPAAPRRASAVNSLA